MRVFLYKNLGGLYNVKHKNALQNLQQNDDGKK